MRMAPWRAPSQLTAPCGMRIRFGTRTTTPRRTPRLTAHLQLSPSPVLTRGQFGVRLNRHACGEHKLASRWGGLAGRRGAN